MRCRTIGCRNLTRNPNKPKCWKKYQMCMPCCMELNLFPGVKCGYDWRVSKRFCGGDHDKETLCVA